MEKATAAARARPACAAAARARAPLRRPPLRRACAAGGAGAEAGDIDPETGAWADDPDALIDVAAAEAMLEEREGLEDQYREALAQKLRDEYARREEAEREQRASFDIGSRLYERGEYLRAAEHLEGISEGMRRGSDVYGETRMWLGMSLQALGRTEEASACFGEVAAMHPNEKIRSQAEYLKYINEAPKLQLGEDERVKVPDLNDIQYRSYSSYGSSSTRSARPASTRATTSDEYLDEMVAWKPPRWVKSAAFRILASVWAVGVCTALYLQQQGP